MTRLVVLVNLMLASAMAQSTGLGTFFLPDSQPTSLGASAVAVNTVGTETVTTLMLACPTAESPGNDACRSASIYPAHVYHTQGSVWGGTTTYPVDDSTTTWLCTLGGGGSKLRGECVKTIASGGSTRTEMSQYDHCYVPAHQLPVVVTAGVDKISRAHYLTIDAEQYVSIRSSLLSEYGCPDDRTIWAGATASTSGTVTSTSSAAVTKTGTAAVAALTGGSGTTAAPATKTAAPASTTASSGASRGELVTASQLALLGAVMVMVGLAM
ncbi:hypothetical protein C8A05DRAFT_47054 [Staphylotrichum tortipilum]|uniref:Secreted protein n=1 Tax=Staphylotrichum tortipilum TaxID=2831512 RepID=A0AAN6MEG4_9PEZI|nr:hypothetical protein C8A05DRAFT_47054 [Staphylotrichum longicolle]